MKVTVTVQREYEMDEARILSDPGFDPPPADTPEDEKRAWLRESFYELCGLQRDEDHLDGNYVYLVDESSDADFWWPPAASVPK